MPRDTVRPVAIKLDPDMRQRVARVATASHRTPHWVMREAIREYVEREERRATLRQEALQAWEAYQATGQHVTQAEADAWLAQLESDQDVDPPPCHL
jgi:predicted transcriptional regulator